MSSTISSKSYEKVGKVSSASVEKHTGKGWKAWVELLMEEGATNWTHQEIVALLKKKYRLTPWWQQGVALGFEIASGRRKVGQDSKGKYMVTATKSLSVGVKTVWKELLSPKGLQVWLQPYLPVRIAAKVPFETKDGFVGEIRTLAKERRIRMHWQHPDWEKPTVVEVLLVPRPRQRCILAINHTGIPDNATRELFKTRWRAAADKFASILSKGKETK